MDTEATKSLCLEAGSMLQREPVDRYRIPATLPNRSRMAKSCCPDQPNIDFEEFVSRVRGFRLELLQIDQGAFRADGSQAYLGDALLGTVRLGRAFVQTWRPPAQSTTIAVRTSRAPAFWQGTLFGLSDLLIGGSEAEIELVSQPGFGVASASFPDHEFRRAAALCGCSSAVDNVQCTMVRLPKPHAAHAIRTAIRALISEMLAHPSDARDPKREQTKRDDLLHRMALVASDGVPFVPSKRVAERARLLEHAVSAIRGRPADVLTVAALCRIAGASERTLHSAFVERYGLPPARFMKAYRLNGARRAFGRVAPQDVKISDVANTWGFWHLGQFAKDYRRWFGELPSETCRRNQVENYPLARRSTTL